MICLRTSFLAAVLFAGCSPVTDGIEPDAPVVDTTAPMITASNPTDMMSKFSVLQPLSVTFDEDIDPSTVNATTVKLTWGNQRIRSYFGAVELDNFVLLRGFGPGRDVEDVLGTLTYDEVSRTLRFVPRAPLRWDTHYQLVLDGVTDLAGNELPMTSLRFTTYINQALDDRRFTAELQPTSYINRRIDANGRVVAHLHRNGPGVDMLWWTDDDPQDTISNSGTVEYTPEGWLKNDILLSIGADNILGTADDVINSVLGTRYDASGLATQRPISRAPGDDAVWGTADDVLVAMLVYTYTGSRMTSGQVNVDPGADMVWGTGDDLCQTTLAHEHDAMGHRVRDIATFCVAGAPGTAANTERYFEQRYDANHVLIFQSHRNDSGSDNIWLTPDDGYLSYDKYDVDANGQLTASYTYTAPGPDTIWNTADDIVGSLSKITYNENGQAILVASYGPGADTILGTADDVIVGYTRTEYDVFGNRTGARSYSVGPDGVPFTGDDPLAVEHYFDTMH